MDQSSAEWRTLLCLLLAQRLELNAIEGVLIASGALTEAHLKEIRQQASDTAKAWSSETGDDVLSLLRIHSLPEAKMRVSPPESQSD
jgi:hypothetical protein